MKKLIFILSLLLCACAPVSEKTYNGMVNRSTTETVISGKSILDVAIGK